MTSIVIGFYRTAIINTNLTVLSKNLLIIPAREILTTETIYTVDGNTVIYQKP